LKRQHAALLTSAQMLDADQLTVVTGISEIRLMENRQAPGGARRHGTLKLPPDTGAVRPSPSLSTFSVFSARTDRQPAWILGSSFKVICSAVIFSSG